MASLDDQGLNLLREWREPISPRRVAVAVIGSLLAHVVMISALVLAPETAFVSTKPQEAFYYRKIVPLYIPVELTQHDPNQGKVTHTLDVRSAAAPALIPQAPRFRAPLPRPVPVATPIPEPPKVEPPKIEPEVAVAPPPPPPTGRLQVGPPPPEKPKLAFENVGAQGPIPQTSDYYQPSSRVPDPRVAAENALRASARPPGSSGISVGDFEEMNIAPSPNQPSAAGPVRSNLQLLSDPKGVDFKPYLIQVLTAVRANWLAVIPESARLGRKGRVLVQFIIDKRGHIPKLVIAESSGTTAMDRAAVAGISASVLPPLPNNFTGSEIRLQLAFGYNQAAVR